jgi:hypothetical protein
LLQPVSWVVGTKAARKLPNNFLEVKINFLNEVSSKVSEFGIPDELVINWDQTGKIPCNIMDV